MRAISDGFKSRELPEVTWVAVPEMLNCGPVSSGLMEFRFQRPYVLIAAFGSQLACQWNEPGPIEWRPGDAKGRVVSEVGGCGNHIGLYREEEEEEDEQHLCEIVWVH